MQDSSPKTKRKRPLILTPRDEKILRTIYAYRYMTGEDVASLLFKRSSKTHVIEILSKLAGGDDLQTHAYLCRFGLPSVGNAERAFTLGAKGRSFLADAGLPITWYFRPYKFKHFSHAHILHNLLITRFMVAAHVWAREQKIFNLLEVRFGHEFGKGNKVVPDCWLLFERISNGNQLPVIVELDRGMEFQKRFKTHIRSRIQYIEDGSYKRMFGSTSVRILYATTGEIPAYREKRRQTMCRWTQEVLEEDRKENWSDVFRIASLEFGCLYDLTLFEKAVWFKPDSPRPLKLLGD